MYYGWITAGVAVLGLIGTAMASLFIREARRGRMETDIEYLKRDVATLMRYFKLTPAEEQHSPRRR